MIFTQLPTNNYRVILASSSETRIKYLRKFFPNFISEKHQINEKKYKCEKETPQIMAKNLAKYKAKSIQDKYSADIIIGSDQLLECNKVIISKPETLDEAKKNLLFLKNKVHFLYSATYAIKDKKYYFSQTKKAEIFFKNISEKNLTNYISNNKKTVLTTVGSYKIEENNKFNFIEVISGDRETIIGFPLKDLVRKISANG